MKKTKKVLLSLSALALSGALAGGFATLSPVTAEEASLGDKIAAIKGLNATYDSSYEEASSGINTSVLPTVRDGGNNYIVFQYDLIEGEDTVACGRIEYDFGNTPYGNGLLRVPAYNIDVYDKDEETFGSGLIFSDAYAGVSPLITSALEGKTITVVVNRSTLAHTMYSSPIGAQLTYDNASGFTVTGATQESLSMGSAACYWSTGSAMTQNAVFGTAQTVSKWSKMGGLFVGNGTAKMENIKVFDENGNDLGLMLGNDYVVSNLSAPEGYLTTFSSADIGHTAPINTYYSAGAIAETAFTPLNDAVNNVNRTMIYSAGDAAFEDTVFPATYNTSLSTKGQALGLYFATGNYKTQFNFANKVKIDDLKSITVRVWSDTMYGGVLGGGSIQFLNSKNETVTSNKESVNLNAYLSADVTSANPLTDYADITIPASDLAVLADEDGYLSGVQVLRVNPSKAGWCVFDEISYELKGELDGQIEMVKGASVRLANPTGLGFTTQIDYATYNALVAKYGEENVATGTLILPTDMIPADGLTKEALVAGDVLHLDVENKGFRNEATAEEDGYYEFRGSIVNILEENIERKFTGLGYVAITVDGETKYEYAVANDNSRSVAEVAVASYKEVSATETEEYSELITWEEHYAYGKYSPYTTEELKVLDGFFSDYNLKEEWITYDGNYSVVTYDETKATWYCTPGEATRYTWKAVVISADVVNQFLADGATSISVVMGGDIYGKGIAGGYRNVRGSAQQMANVPQSFSISLAEADMLEGETVNGIAFEIYFYSQFNNAETYGIPEGFSLKITPVYAE